MVQISRTRAQPSSSNRGGAMQILLILTLCIVSFYTGTISSPISNQAVVHCDKSKSDKNNASNGDGSDTAVPDERIEAIVQQRVEAELSKLRAGSKSSAAVTSTQQKEVPYFPSTTSSFLKGMTLLPKDDFTEKFDYGPPMEKAKNSNSHVLLMYNTKKAYPSSPDSQHSIENEQGSGLTIMDDVEKATENCDTMNVVQLNNPGNTRQCFAIVGNYESYHIQRWMRIPLNGGKLNSAEPLRAVSRGQDKNGVNQFIPPTDSDIRKHWEVLRTYFESVDEVLSALKPITKKVAKDNTIIIMTCNMGQSELLMNFVCNAKAKGLSIENVLVFPTDLETKDLAEGLGLATFYDEKIFGDMPSSEAKRYGDRAFVAMMFAKVVCVQLINHLGYDVLFQDVDVVWYTNPLEYFHDSNNPYKDFDMYFQDDGAHSTRYAPLSANSGFYYVRNNQKTKYLFTSLLYAGDQILKSHSHQEALVQLMNEYSSLFGLRVKVLSRDMIEFPGGWHYHKKNKEYMMKVVKEEVSPVIFHMSWTKNKDNKIKFFQQMGQWYVNDMCIAHTKDDIIGNHGMAGDDNASLLEPCCLSEPNIICHYRDKPSKVPCRDVDPIDKGRPSFW